MIRSMRMAFELLSKEAKIKLLRLIPLMMMSSASDVITVIFLSTFVKALTNTNESLPGVAQLQASLGLGDTPTVALTAVLGFTVILLANGVMLLSTYRVNQFGFGQIVVFSEAVLSALLRRDYEWFLQQSTPALKQQALIETQRVVTILIVAAAQMTGKLVGATVIVGYLFWMEPTLTLVLVVALSAFYGLLYELMRRGVVKYGTIRSLSDRRRHQITEESLIGVKELKLHGLEHKALERFQVPNLVYSNALVYITTLQAVGKPALEVVGVFGIGLMMVSFQVTDRPLDGVLTLMATYGVAGYRLLPTLQLVFRTVVRAQAETHALDSVYNQIKEPPPDVDLSNTPPVEFKTALVATGLSYTYPGTEQPVLRDIDLTVKRGSWVALVGSTGSGKTTLVDLLMGLLPPTSGSLVLDGEPISDPARVKRWQELIGYVPQNLFMSDTTMARNIAFGDSEPDMELVKKSADMACVSTFIEELPAGYETPIGERGMRVSGGQRQRIGISRALYRRPDFLVLDEATSALDNRTEASVMAALRENFAETTVLMIAHRLSTTRHCDTVVLLEKGRILDQGSYDELLERNAYFRQLVEASQEQ